MTGESRVLEMIGRQVKPGGPGMVYIASDASGAIFERAEGLADIAGRVPMALTTTMSAFSMTKTLTAIAVLQLAEQGALRLDDDAGRYVAHPYGSGIAIRHLITHTSGIPNPIPLRWVHAAERQAGFDEPAALRGILAKHGKLRSEPGERYRYSNIGYWLLGQVVENVSGRSFPVYMKERLFEPLGLGPGEIGFSIRSPENQAKGYLAALSMMNLLKSFLIDRGTWDGYEGRWLRIRDVYANGPAFGGAIGSAAAFGTILRDLLKTEPVLLSRASMGLLYKQARTRSGRTVPMTLGWHVGELAGRPYYFKEGGGAGFHCEMRTYPEKGLASVVMVNRTSFRSNSVLSGLDRCLLG